MSPVFINFGSDDVWITEWWRAWRDLVHVTKYGMNNSDFCNLSPWNPDNKSLDVFRDPLSKADSPAASERSGTNSLDAVYVLCTDQTCAPNRKRRRS